MRITFRALEDRSLTDAADNTVTLDGAERVGIVHPLELDDARLTAWRRHLSDYELVPSFPQIERSVVRVDNAMGHQTAWAGLEGVTVPALTLRGRAERLGWNRGQGVDNGEIHLYWKHFRSAGIDAFLSLSGDYFGAERDQPATLGGVSFARHDAAVKASGYGPPREILLPLGEVPAVVFSEAVSDFQSIAGRRVEAS